MRVRHGYQTRPIVPVWPASFAAGLAVSRFWHSSLGNQTLWRVLPLVGAGVALLWLARRPASRLGLAAIAALMALLMAADVAASHAAGARSWTVGTVEATLAAVVLVATRFLQSLALDLPSDSAGRSKGLYAAQAANLSVDRTWMINALIQRPSTSTEVAFTVTTRRPAVKIDVSRSPGLPPVYTIHADASTDVHVYLDPGRPGLDEFHVTLIGTSGHEVPADKLTVSAARESAQRVPLTVRKLDNVGHFVADLGGAVRGRYQFSIETALTGDAPLHADITIPVS